MSSIRVMLVDDQVLLRTGFRMVLAAQPDMEVVAEAGDGVEALQVLRGAEVDVVLMDVRMPKLDGVETTRRICADQDPPKVLILTTFDLDEYAFSGLKAGASGFMLKDVPPVSCSPRSGPCTAVTPWSPRRPPGGCWTASRRCSRRPACSPSTSGWSGSPSGNARS